MSKTTNIDEEQFGRLPKCDWECDCNITVPHKPEHHNRVAEALQDDPNQCFIIHDGMPYLVDAEDILQELKL